MAATVTDRDGKSKTASAVDAQHYPEQNEVPHEHPLVSDGLEINGIPEIESIRQRAYELWVERGCPHGSADHDWHLAEQELQANNGSQRIADKLHESSGSVQR